MKHIQTTYPPYIDQISRVLGDLRTESNRELHKAVPEYDMGDRHSDVEALGVACEMIFSSYLTMEGIDHEMSPLVDDSPVVGPDLIINGKAFDVKGIPHYGKKLLVNYKAHNKPKGIDFYAFVKPSKGYKADIWIYPKKEISFWEVKNMGYTNAYCKSI